MQLPLSSERANSCRADQLRQVRWPDGLCGLMLLSAHRLKERRSQVIAEHGEWYPAGSPFADGRV